MARCKINGSLSFSLHFMCTATSGTPVSRQRPTGLDSRDLQQFVHQPQEVRSRKGWTGRFVSGSDKAEWQRMANLLIASLHNAPGVEIEPFFFVESHSHLGASCYPFIYSGTHQSSISVCLGRMFCRSEEAVCCAGTVEA